MAQPKKHYDTFKEAEAYLHSEGLQLNPATGRYEIDMEGHGGGTTWAEIVPDHEPGFRIRHGHID
jgi:hypothetical protein